MLGRYLPKPSGGGEGSQEDIAVASFQEGKTLIFSVTDKLGILLSETMAKNKLSW